MEKQLHRRKPYGESKRRAEEQVEKLRERGYRARLIETNRQRRLYAPYKGILKLVEWPSAKERPKEEPHKEAERHKGRREHHRIKVEVHQNEKRERRERKAKERLAEENARGMEELKREKKAGEKEEIKTEEHPSPSEVIEAAAKSPDVEHIAENSEEAIKESGEASATRQERRDEFLQELEHRSERNKREMGEKYGASDIYEIPPEERASPEFPKTTNANVQITMESGYDKNTAMYRSLLDALNISDEANLLVTKRGLHVREMDPSSISLVDIDIPNKLFPKYEVGEGTNIGLNVENLRRELSASARKGGALKLETRGGIAHLELYDSEGKEEYEHPLIDVVEHSRAESKLPDIKFSSTVRLDAKTLKEALRKAKTRSSHISFEVKDGKLYAESHGDAGKYAEELPIVSAAGENGKTTFVLEQLQKFLKAAVKGTTVELDLKEKEPLRLAYTLYGDMKAQYFLAPYMED